MLLPLTSHPKQKARGNWRSESTQLWIIQYRNVNIAACLGEDDEEEEECGCEGVLQLECSTQRALL